MYYHTNKEMKQEAKLLLRGHWGPIILALIINLLIPGVCMGVFRTIFGEESILYFLASIIVSLVSYVFAAGLTQIFLNLCRKKEVLTGDLFYAFQNHPDRYIGAGFLVGIIVSLPILPGIIMLYSAVGISIFTLYTAGYAGGLAAAATGTMAALAGIGCLLSLVGVVFSIILSIRYAMVTYLLLDNPQMRVTDSLRESGRLMQGHKGRYFGLTLSFFGWIFLGVFTMGLLYLWLLPYMEATFTLFYMDMIGEQVPADSFGNQQSTTPDL